MGGSSSSANTPTAHRGPFLIRNLLAGLTLAAVAIPEQMATARLGGFSPEVGFFAFIAGSLGFAALGSNRLMSVGADSTITPIFAGALALTAATASPHAFVLAGGLALMVGAIVLLAGILRMGWIADLLSVPVTIGFLAGIAVHILASQLPSALGVAGGSGGVPARLGALAGAAPRLNPWSLAIAAGVLAFTAGAHRLSARIPGPLIAIVLAIAAVSTLNLETRGVAVLGTVRGGLPIPSFPGITIAEWLKLAPLALLIALVVMVQTAATSRAFPSDPDHAPRLDRDFIGVGLGSVLAGLIGAFPVNASPPRTAVVAESGGGSKLAGLAAVAVVGMVLAVGTRLLTHIPQAALAGVLLFIALRIVRLGQMVDVARASPAEFALVLVTAAAIILMPIQDGVAVGIGLSLLHGMWSSARPRMVPLQHLPGTTVWWPVGGSAKGETVDGVVVVGFQAPLSFLNAYGFRQRIGGILDAPAGAPRLLVLEASGIIDIDFTAAEVVREILRLCREKGTTFALARLEAADAAAALDRLGLRSAIGADHIFQTVDEAVATLAPKASVVGAAS